MMCSIFLILFQQYLPNAPKENLSQLNQRETGATSTNAIN